MLLHDNRAINCIAMVTDKKNGKAGISTLPLSNPIAALQTPRGQYCAMACLLYGANHSSHRISFTRFSRNFNYPRTG